MNKFLLMLIVTLQCASRLTAQTYYYMWRGQGESGKPEWIANSRLGYDFTGIQFTTADSFRGVISGNGRWVAWDPQDPVTTQQNVGFILSNLSHVNHAALGTQGAIVADRFVMTDLSSSGNIDSYYGYGRNGDVICSCQMQKWLRLNSYSGIAMWGNGGGESNDNPAFLIANNYIEANTPFVQKNGAITHIKNNISTTLNLNSTNTAAWFGTTTKHGLEIGTDGTAAIYIGNGQNLFLGFDKEHAESINDSLKNQYNVFVRKGILSADYAIAPVASWADFVFFPNYTLPPLSYVENYIRENSHLPNVPTAEDVKENGYSQHEINKVLLQKIEELSLYIIQQQKEIDDLRIKLKTKIQNK